MREIEAARSIDNRTYAFYSDRPTEIPYNPKPFPLTELLHAAQSDRGLTDDEDNSTDPGTDSNNTDVSHAHHHNGGYKQNPQNPHHIYHHNNQQNQQSKHNRQNQHNPQQ